MPCAVGHPSIGTVLDRKSGKLLVARQNATFTNCLSIDCFVAHAFKSTGEGLIDLGALPGVNSSSAIEINHEGLIIGVNTNARIPMGEGVHAGFGDFGRAE